MAAEHNSSSSRKRRLTPKRRKQARPWKPEPPCPYDLNNAPGYRRLRG